jgi:hypothetical protein
MVRIAAISAACFAIYFLSSGVAFVLMYRVGIGFPSRFASFIYSPLEALAKRSSFFQRSYTGFHWWMYRQFIADSSPPPPPRVPLA